MIALRCSMQEEDIIEHTNGKCDVFNVSKRKIFLSILMWQVSFVCVFSRSVDRNVT
jgi:hypothetical protein